MRLRDELCIQMFIALFWSIIHNYIIRKFAIHFKWLIKIKEFVQIKIDVSFVRYLMLSCSDTHINIRLKMEVITWAMYPIAIKCK